ncbi:hypothetical protein LZF92_03070 [Ligilactobacillus salivarius]|uniref:hypothetical protein n=1 Tax=Ligilactobacillus salivarius TaxID=1624 RepID=UPI001F304541|nr:hypothetical protein [Ligilactobacillus salivarius]MDU4203500.1 hypothetical protein [Negativicoccus succinicivorans]UIP51995.1 hypothetical protein LZF92_03070 [Ligilactobacillus salivarius]
MAINFEPIFSEMANGPEKIKGNFDKLVDIQNWSVTEVRITPINGWSGGGTWKKLKLGNVTINAFSASFISPKIDSVPYAVQVSAQPSGFPDWRRLGVFSNEHPGNILFAADQGKMNIINFGSTNLTAGQHFDVNDVWIEVA